jgi:putative ABC transport system permease protein
MLKPWWKVTGELPTENQVLLGAEAAKKLALGVGVVLSTEGWDLPVSGILEATGSQDDQIVFAHLNTAQFVLGKEGSISMAEVAALCKDCPIDDMVGQISAVLPGADVMAIQQVVKGRMEAIGHFRNFSLGVSALVVLVGGLVVLVTMMGSVRERTAEIGIFRAIGYRRSHVMRIVLLEAVVVSTIAGVLGYLAGFGGSKLAFPFFAQAGGAALEHGGHAVTIPFAPGLALTAVAAALALGVLASLYPALVAARMDPNDALRAL